MPDKPVWGDPWPQVYWQEEPKVTPPLVGNYADAVSEFMDWESYRYDWGSLEVRGILKFSMVPKTEAEYRTYLLVTYDRLCHKLEEMGAPLAGTPEFHITPDGHGHLKGEVTIRLSQDSQYAAA